MPQSLPIMQFDEMFNSKSVTHWNDSLIDSIAYKIISIYKL